MKSLQIVGDTVDDLFEQKLSSGEASLAGAVGGRPVPRKKSSRGGKLFLSIVLNGFVLLLFIVFFVGVSSDQFF